MEINYPNLSGKTFLVVEDDKTSFALLNTILKRCKVNVLWADSGKDAIKTATTRDDIDLILMDIKMPDIDGFEVTKKIKQYNPGIPIIAQTAFALSGDEERTYEAGCDIYISKPIDKKELINNIRKIFK